MARKANAFGWEELGEEANNARGFEEGIPTLLPNHPGALSEVWPPVVLHPFLRLPRTLDSQTLVRKIYQLEPCGCFCNLQMIKSWKDRQMDFFKHLPLEEQTGFH